LKEDPSGGEKTPGDMQKECLSCIADDTMYCTDHETFTDGKCCTADLHESIRASKCTAKNGNRTCSTSSKVPKIPPSDKFKKALCTNLVKCKDDFFGSSKVIKLDESIPIFRKINTDTYLKDKDEYCSYWIKPPVNMDANDYVEIRITNFATDQVTIMIV